MLYLLIEFNSCYKKTKYSVKEYPKGKPIRFTFLTVHHLRSPTT